jgi:peptidoglycan/LPS O-acetylase OafA/YrhL
MADSISPLPPSIQETPPSPPDPLPKEWSYRKITFAMGLLYGITMRLLLGSYYVLYMYTTFNALLIGVSIAVGFITISISYRKNDQVMDWMFRPWGAAIVMIVTAAIIFSEGNILIYMMIPYVICLPIVLLIVLVSSSVGGIIAGVVRRWRSREGLGDSNVLRDTP